MREGAALACAAVACVCACTAAPERAPPSTASAWVAPPHAAAVDVSVDLHAPARVRWAPSTLAPPQPTLGVVLTNRTASPVDVSDVRVRLEAVRAGVTFRCAREVGAPPGAHEPRVLAPGASFTFARALDCSLPLVGTYAVRVETSFGGGPWREAHAFTLRVDAQPTAEPRPIAALPGVWGALGASSVAFGVSPDGDGALGRIVVAVVNGGRDPVELPPLRLALRVYRVGTPIPCVDEPTRLAAPPLLAPGASYREPIEVSCLGLSVPGRYDVAARVVVDGIGETEIGRLRVEITNDPARRTPQTPGAPSGPGGPGL
jgi:hypothetical protein